MPFLWFSVWTELLPFLPAKILPFFQEHLVLLEANPDFMASSTPSSPHGGPSGTILGSLRHLPFSALDMTLRRLRLLAGWSGFFRTWALLTEPAGPSHHIHQLRGGAWAQLGQMAPESDQEQQGKPLQPVAGRCGVTHKDPTPRSVPHSPGFKRMSGRARGVTTRHRGVASSAHEERGRRHMRAHSRRPRAADSEPGWRRRQLEAGRPGRRRAPVGRQRPRIPKPLRMRPGLVSRGCLWRE